MTKCNCASAQAVREILERFKPCGGYQMAMSYEDVKAIIDRAQMQLGELVNQKESGSKEAGLDGRIKMLDDKLDELNNRLERRRSDLKKEQQCTISNIQHLGSAWVLPHPERKTPEVKKMVSDPEIEKIAQGIKSNHL